LRRGVTDAIGESSSSELDASEHEDEQGDVFAALDDIESDEEPAGLLGSGATLLPPYSRLQEYALASAPKLALTPRPYQRDAVDAWLRSGGRGMVVLPTGAGKTVVALDIIARLGVRTLIVVPTIELLRQWRAEVAARLNIPIDEVGIVGGGERIPGSITVITYDSAALPRRGLAEFGLLVCDEVHHLPAQKYQTIARKCHAPWRLGLSATLDRTDWKHPVLEELMGAIVYERHADELAAQQHIAAYRERRIYVDLAPEEEVRYETLMAEWRWYLATRRSQLGDGPGLFAALVRRSGFDKAARSALRAHHEARLVALNAGAKIGEIDKLLRQHTRDKVLVFSEYTDMVDRISRALILPAITYRTPTAERRAILQGFRAGELTKLVTGRVLNEGVDVPDANVAIVASGSASMREYVQRLGRVLRPKPEEAQLYELITRRTTERNAARRRRPRSRSGR
jgi:superfamily II DNA or RNA helicase